MAETAPKTEAKKPAAGVKAPVLGKQAKADLPKALFSEPFHESLVHEAARADLNARRRGTHSTLTRGEVAMTTAKAWRQKGTGRARAGALSVPHRYGGGVAFGPKPRHYTFKVNRKARRRALRAALSVHAERGSIAVLDGSAFEKPSTKQAAKALEVGRRRAHAGRARGRRGGRREELPQHPRRHVALATAAGVADVIGAASLVVSEAALKELEGRAGVMDPRQVIIRPVVSEKSYALMADGKYTFRVHDRAHKTQIAQAVEEIFDVHVRSVKTAKVRAKPKRRGLHGHQPLMEEGDRPARSRRADRAVRGRGGGGLGRLMANRKTKPTSPGAASAPTRCARS